MKLYLYNKTYFYKILSFILIICNLGSVTASAYVSLDKCDLSKNNSSITQNTDDKNHELIEKFQPVIENIFLNRNSAILTAAQYPLLSISWFSSLSLQGTTIVSKSLLIIGTP